MAEVKISENRYTVDPLYQWDKNQKLYIYGVVGIPDPEIHFANTDMERTIVCQPSIDTKGVISVDIPNSLLQKSHDINVYICGYENKTFKTYYKIVVPVKGRQKPEDYSLEVGDGEVYSFVEIEKIANDAKNDASNALEITTGFNKKLDDCFTSVSSGKTLIASAITDKNVPTDADASFETMANNIRRIAASLGDAQPEDVLEGKTFTNVDGIEYNGAMKNNGAVDETFSASATENQTYTIPKGYHNGEGSVRVKRFSTNYETSVVSRLSNEDTGATTISGLTIGETYLGIFSHRAEPGETVTITMTGATEISRQSISNTSREYYTEYYLTEILFTATSESVDILIVAQNSNNYWLGTIIKTPFFNTTVEEDEVLDENGSGSDKKEEDDGDEFV